MPSGIVEALTGMTASITSDHAYIHAGKGFELIGVTSSIAAAGAESISFKTPALTTGKVIHFRPAAFSSTANLASLVITEGAVMSGGTAAVPVNLNRLSAGASKAQVAKAATLTTAGSVTVYQDTVGLGGTPSSSGGGSGGGADNEIVLKPDTTYAITMSNIGATTATVCYYRLFWYEE